MQLLLLIYSLYEYTFTTLILILVVAFFLYLTPYHLDNIQLTTSLLPLLLQTILNQVFELIDHLKHHIIVLNNLLLFGLLIHTLPIFLFIALNHLLYLWNIHFPLSFDHLQLFLNIPILILFPIPSTLIFFLFQPLLHQIVNLRFPNQILYFVKSF